MKVEYKRPKGWRFLRKGEPSKAGDRFVLGATWFELVGSMRDDSKFPIIRKIKRKKP